MNIDKAFKQLKEELLLEGKSWGNFYDSLSERLKTLLNKESNKKNIDKMELVKAFRFLDPTATETNAGKYSNWLANLFMRQSAMINLLTRVSSEENYIYNILKRFNQIQSNLEKPDINQYDDIDELKEVINKYESQKSSKKLRGKLDVQSGKWGIKKVNSATESCELGKGTKWCITNKEEFDAYNSRNTIFFLTDGKNKYALTITNDGKGSAVYDEQDNRLGGINFLYNKIPKKIVDYIKKESNLNEEFVDMMQSEQGDTASIYRNPSKREMKNLIKESGEQRVRFIVDLKNENIYVFPIDLLHAVASKKLGIDYRDKIESKIFAEGGYAEGKIHSKKVKALSRTFTDEQKEWIERYIAL